jgi:hypothetical protein
LYGAFQQDTEAGRHALGHRESVGDDQGADRGAADDQQLGRLPQRPELSAVDGETAKHAAEYHDDADDEIHSLRAASAGGAEIEAQSPLMRDFKGPAEQWRPAPWRGSCSAFPDRLPRSGASPCRSSN